MSFLFTNKTLRLNNLKTRAAMNAKISVFITCVEAITYLLLYDFHDRAFKCKQQSKIKDARFEFYKKQPLISRAVAKRDVW